MIDSTIAHQSAETVSVEKVRSGDLRNVSEVEKACFVDPYPMRLLQELARLYPETFFVAKSGSRVVGYTVSSVEENTSHLYSIAVLPSHEGHGVGSLLLDALTQTLQRLDVKEITLEVRRSNDGAIRFYRDRGFQTTGERRSYYSNGEDAILMKRSL